MITIQSTLAPDSAGTQVDNFALVEQHSPRRRGLQLRARQLRATTTISSRSRRAPWTSGSRRASSAHRRSPSATIGSFRLVASNSGTVAAQERGGDATRCPPASSRSSSRPAARRPPRSSLVPWARSRPVPSRRSSCVHARARRRPEPPSPTGRRSAPTRPISSGRTTRARPMSRSARCPRRPQKTPAPPAVTPVDLAVTVEPPSGLSTVGTTGSWTVRVVNNGPGTATNVTLDGVARGSYQVRGTTLKANECLPAPGHPLWARHARARRVANR